jgi:ABC-type nitrate/sulfonate/bicarbonate transport system permease component
MSQSALPSSLPNPTAARAASVLSRFPVAALYRLIAGLAILLFWEAIVRGFAPAYVAKPSSIIAVIPKVLVDPAFLTATGATLLAVAQGLLIAIIFGTIIGLLMGRSIIAEKALRHYINGFYAVPMVVVLPLMSLWFGYTGAARLATIVFASLFSIIVNVADGAKAVPKEYLEVARSFRSDRWRMIPEIVLPASTPYFLAGLRLAAGRALIGAVVAEFFTAIGGLGYYILFNSRTFHHNEAFVGVLLLAAFGVSFELLVAWSIKRFMPWYRRDEPAE